MIRVLVVDDHPVVRTGLRQILTPDNGIEIAGECDCARTALEQNRSTDCDLVLLDLGLPDAAGIEVLQQMRRDTPDRAILALAPRCDNDMAARAVKAGASGCLGKECNLDELVEAVRTIANGGTYPPDVNGAAHAHSPHDRLSNRELEVFTMLASGKRSKEIASQLALSVKTVSTYRSRVLEKLKLSTNAEIGVYAVRHGLLDGLSYGGGFGETGLGAAG
jgi:DNA-binding NarL/FixJ family response regulator